MLVCEALNLPMLEQRIAALRTMGMALQASLFEDIPSYHIATPDIAKLAKSAGVGELVLSHLIPPISNEAAAVQGFVQGMNAIYGGSIRVAQDMQRIAVTARAR
jgi:ribonuclease Z